MGRENRLGALRVRVRGDDDVEIAVAPSDKRLLQLGEQDVEPIDRVANPEPEIGRDLVVSTSRRMQFSPDVAKFVGQRLFDVHVNVFKRRRKFELAALDSLFDRGQFAFDRFEFFAREEPDVGEHARVPDRAANILLVHSLVETDALAELFHSRVGRFSENSAPRLAGLVLIVLGHLIPFERYMDRYETRDAPLAARLSLPKERPGNFRGSARTPRPTTAPRRTRRATRTSPARSCRREPRRLSRSVCCSRRCCRAS